MKNLKQLHASLKDHVILSGGGPDDDGLAARLLYKHYADQLQVIASWGEGWDHVSVSLGERCPFWDEMCFVKDMFFHSSETVIQYHPAESQYINNHPHCLHLWRSQHQAILLPPLHFV